jgi:dTDP-4-dehydrorhamnose reductase
MQKAPSDMPTPTILVTGSNGQLGSELKDLAGTYKEAVFIFCNREELPITNIAALQRAFEQHRPDYFINCAAYTAVDKAETEKEEALAINAIAPGNIATLCAQWGCRFVHISTDYVFDGTSSAPLKENAPVKPVNAYGESKLKGEELVMEHNPQSIIIRTSWVYSSYGKNFVKTMLKLMADRKEISVVADQTGSPTYAADLAEAVLQIVFSGQWVPGIYHYSNEGTITWHQFAEAIREETGSQCIIQPIDTEQYPTPAKRPAWSVMDKSKIQQTFGLELQPWKDSLRQCLRKLQQGA